MNARRCQGCAAPLPEVPAGESQRCPFCGLVHDAGTAGAAQAHHIYVQTAGSGRAAGQIVRWVVIGAIVVTLATLVPVIGALYAGWRVAESIAPEAFDAVSGALATFCPPDKKIIHGMTDAALLPSRVLSLS